MNDPVLESKSDAPARAQRAEGIIAEVFRKAGWQVRRPAPARDSPGADMVIRRGAASYAVEVKAAAEGRSDRLIPLWAQACLEAVHAAAHHPPLAVVAAPRIVLRAAEQVVRFASKYAPDSAVGVIDFAGLRLFRGPHLEGLDSEDSYLPARSRGVPSESSNLFSDLNQWMLKVLLAPELPDKLLSAPRGRYRNASQLARAANVSVMSAFRLVQQLQREGFLNESSPYLNLVRRKELLERWQAASAVRPVNELPVRFHLRGDPHKQLHRMLQSGRACLALFASAEALGIGFVHGVPSHVYVQRLAPGSVAAWKNIAPVEPGERPDIILRQAPAPHAVFRAVVRVDGVPASDILQVWLDVSSHPSRGREQADLIRRRILNKVMKERHGNG
jgi:hypothetical protein